MNTADVDAMVRDVIVHFGLPFTNIGAVEAPAGWNIEVRADTGKLLRFAVRDGRPTSVRIAIQQHLQAIS